MRAWGRNGNVIKADQLSVQIRTKAPRIRRLRPLVQIIGEVNLHDILELNPMTQILRIDASARTEGSVTRDLTSKIIDHLGNGDVMIRNLATGVPLLNEHWVGATFTPPADRTADQAETLAFSDTLIAEIMAADTLVIGLPIYNFGVPAALKAWIDQIARVGVTFMYTENGPVGLLDGKRAIVAMASGGTKAGSEVDFATGYLRHVLGFIGIHDVTIVTADQMMVDPDAALQSAHAQVDALAA